MNNKIPKLQQFMLHDENAYDEIYLSKPSSHASLGTRNDFISISQFLIPKKSHIFQ